MTLTGCPFSQIMLRREATAPSIHSSYQRRCLDSSRLYGFTSRSELLGRPGVALELGVKASLPLPSFVVLETAPSDRTQDSKTVDTARRPEQQYMWGFGFGTSPKLTRLPSIYTLGVWLRDIFLKWKRTVGEAPRHTKSTANLRGMPGSACSKMQKWVFKSLFSWCCSAHFP